MRQSMEETTMAADELSPINMPAIAWTTNTNSRESRTEPKDKEKKANTASKRTERMPRELEFEQTEHELDSIA
jgi:hypothetical protein